MTQPLPGTLVFAAKSGAALWIVGWLIVIVLVIAGAAYYFRVRRSRRADRE